MSDDYEIGYGKPPRHTRFRQGQSGNPKGRPPGTKNLRADLAEELSAKIEVKEGGRPATITKQRAMLKSALARAIKGDVRAANIVFGLIERLLSRTDSEDPEERLSEEDEMILELFQARAKQEQ